MFGLVDRVPINPDSGETSRTEGDSYRIDTFVQQSRDIETVVINRLVIIGHRG